MSRPHPPPAAPRRTAALTLLILGAVGFLVSLPIDDFWEAYPEIASMLMEGSMPDGEDAFAVSAILTLPVVSLSMPFLIVWLEKSRLLVWLLRVCTFFTSAFLWYFLLTESGSEELLAVLTSSSSLTFVGLCVVRPARPETPSPS